MAEMNAATSIVFDPVAEQLLTEGRDRKFAGLGGRERATRWAFAVAFVVTASTLAAFPHSERAFSPLSFVVLVAAFAVASRIEFEVGSGGATPTELILVPMLFLLPAGTVPLAVAGGLVAGRLPELCRGTLPLERISVTIGNAWYAIAPAAVFLAFGEPDGYPAAWGVLAVALVAQFASDFSISVAREWLALRIDPRRLVGPLLWVFMIDALLAPIGLAAAVASDTTRAALLLPLPLLGLIWVFARERTDRLDQAVELSGAYRGTAYLLGDVLEADDEYTGTHSRQVVELVLGVCDELGLDRRSRRTAEFAALLHDIGKIRIPSEIINKPGLLTPAERAIVNTHAEEGERLLLPIGGLLAQVGTIVRSCHESFDGSGYPDGLAGEQIPLLARIVA